MLKKLAVFALLAVIFLASSWSLLHPGFFRVHDYIHAARVAEMLRGLQDGQFPVRWTSNFGYGYGMPLFEFYAPLPYFVGALLYWLGFPIITTLKLLFAGCSLLTIIGAYKLGNKLFGGTGGVILAATLTLAPYRALNLFVRGALSEAWGMMALPWILLGIVKVVRGERGGWLMLVISLVTLMLSHNITTLLFVPLSVAWAVGYYWWYQRPVIFSKTTGLFLATLVGCYVLAVGLSTFYLVPAIAEKNYTQVDAIFSGYFHYSHHFLYIRQFFKPNWGYGGSQWGPYDGISYFLGGGQLIGLFASSLLVAWAAKKEWLSSKKSQSFISKIVKVGQTNALYIGSAGLMGLALFMTLLRSKPIWDALPFLVFVQFPWRWLSVAATFLALIVAYSVVTIKTGRRRVIYMMVLVVLALGNAIFFRPEAYLDNADSLYYVDGERIQTHMSSILPDYIPKQMPTTFTPPETLFLVPEGRAKNVEVVIDKGHQRLLKVNDMNEMHLDFTIADFPGWYVEIDGQPAEKLPGEGGGFAVDVPAGEHFVGAYFGSTPVRFWSDVVSAVSVGVLLGVALYQSKQKVAA